MGSCRKNLADQIRVRQAENVWSHSNGNSMFAVKSIVRNVTASFVDIKKTPDVGEIGSKGAGIGLQRRTKVVPKECGQYEDCAAQRQVGGNVDKRRHDGDGVKRTMQPTWLLRPSDCVLNWIKDGGEAFLKKV